MAFNLGAFAGGIGQGIEQGQTIRERYQQMVDRQNLLKAQAAAAQAMSQGPIAQQGPQQPPQQAQGAPPTPVPMPGAQPMPQTGQAGPAPTPAPQQSAPAAQAPAAMPAPPPRLPTAAAPQMGGPQPSPGPQASGQPKDERSDPTYPVHQDMSRTLQTLYASVLKANPDLKTKPLVAYEAVDSIIKQMTSADQSEKATLQAYNGVLRLQLEGKIAEQKAQEAAAKLAEDRETKMAKIAAQTQIAAQNGLTRIKVAELNDESREKVASMTAQERLQAAGITAGAHVEAAQIGAAARDFATQYGGDERAWAAQLKFDSDTYRTQGGSMGTDKPAPTRAPFQAPIKKPLGQQGPAGNIDPAKERSLALSHIRQGADPAKVRQIYQQRTGQRPDF